MIQVKLEHETVYIGGNFQDALKFVKGFEGRTYNPETKTWTVPISKKEFLKSAAFHSLPVDLSNGDHQTAYGNIHEADMWNTEKKVWNAQGQIASKYAEAEEALEKSTVEKLQAIKVDEKFINLLVLNHFCLEAVMDRYNVKFRSAQRQVRIETILNEHVEAYDQLLSRQIDENEAITERIMEEAGYE
jgi:hypothetical protein